MFKIESKYLPSIDQENAIEKLVDGINNNERYQVLMGVTGSGKTFTMANVIERVNKPTLILSHNKTLAGQLYSEFKELFPNNKVCYYISYFDYYMPEAYIPQTDTYIEKDSSINDEIEMLRHEATTALLTRDDVIVVASVSCIYGIGEKEEYAKMVLKLNKGQNVSRDEVMSKLIDMTYERNDYDFKRGVFRVRGDSLDVIAANMDKTGYRIEFFGDEIDRIVGINALTGDVINEMDEIVIYPASHYVVGSDRLKTGIDRIKEELNDRLKYFKENNKLLEAERLEQRCNYDIEMLEETGFCKGIENYSAALAGRKKGEEPTTLLDFFPDDFLLLVDESHVSLPQVHAMYNGDRARKQNLVEYGFRLPSALDNRPLTYDEFIRHINKAIFVSATPGDEELSYTNGKYVEQIIRPTGLLDPIIEVRKTIGQIDDLINEIRIRQESHERVMITTLTKKMAEELTEYLKELDISVTYMHSEVKSLERLQIIHDLRDGTYDVLVGINLLREGLDIPEVSLIAIMDADKEGFLRSYRSLIQTIGRAARNANGKVIMYADKITDSMKQAIDETNRRRQIQDKFNKDHNIVPTTIKKEIREVVKGVRYKEKIKKISKKEQEKTIEMIEEEMNEAARNLDFERAIELRDILYEMKSN